MLLPTGCLSARPGGAPLPPSPAQFDVVMTEYRFDHLPEAPAGRVVIRARNAGSVPHSMVLVQLDEDLPPIDVQLHSDARRAVPTLAQITPHPPGSSDSMAVDLKPGRYGFVCFVKDPDGVPHSLKGMSSEFRVR